MTHRLKVTARIGSAESVAGKKMNKKERCLCVVVQRARGEEGKSGTKSGFGDGEG